MSNLHVSHGGGAPLGYDVTSSGVLVASANEFRKFWACVNASDTPIYLALCESNAGVCPAEVGKGIYLSPNGGAFELNNINMYYGEIWAIHGIPAVVKRLCVQPGS